MKTFPHSQQGKSYFLFILIAIVAIGSGVLVQNAKKPPAALPEFKKAILLPTPKALGEVNFTDNKGNAFGIEQLQGKWSILFFGFTYCPDICPTTMQTLKQVKQDLSKTGLWNNYQVVMVTVDPERDDTERLNNYVPFFDPDFIGIRASLEHTISFAKNVGILFFKGKTLENGGYDVDHGASIILINPQGQYAGVLTAPHLQSDISADLSKLAKYAGIVPSTEAPPYESKNKELASPELTAKTPELSIQNAWIRPAPPKTPSMAAYFDLVNNSSSDITIVASSSPQFAHTMIHDTIIKDDIVSMQHLDSITIPAGKSVSLKPAAKHMMLMGSKNPMNEGDSAKVTLVSDQGKAFEFDVLVRQAPKSD